MTKRKKLWIQSALRGKGGELSRQLEIPVEDNIPFTLLRKIRDTKIGDIVVNPTKTGKKQIRVTRLLKRRAVLALTLKNINRRK